MEESIMVALRVKPCEGNLEWAVKDNTISRLGTTEMHLFDTIYSPNSSNEDIYSHSVGKLVEEAMNGYNVAICAYGQSGAGKTHTLTGSNSFGLVHLLFNDLFSRIPMDKRKFLIRVSYLEIYNERVRDLLGAGEDLLIQEKDDNPFVNGLTEHVITCNEEIEDILFNAAENRQFGETALNERSSRSHAILRICLESNDGIGSFKSRTSIINMVDLAGSENGDATAGLISRQKEGGNINKSLLALTKVISILSDKKRCNGHIPYRDSKLTRILKPCLGGNSKTYVICCVNPKFVMETNSTLKFARQVKLVKSRPTINVVTEDGVLAQYLAEIEALKLQLETQKVEVANNDNLETERERLKSLMKSIINEKDNGSAPQLKRANNRRMTWAPGNGKLGLNSPPSKVSRGGLSRITEQDESDKFAEFLARMDKKNSSFDRLSEENEDKIDIFDTLECVPENRFSDFSTVSAETKASEENKDYSIEIKEKDNNFDLKAENNELYGKLDEALNEIALLKNSLASLNKSVNGISYVEDLNIGLADENKVLKEESTLLKQEIAKLKYDSESVKQKSLEDVESSSERSRLRQHIEEQAALISKLKSELQAATTEKIDADDKSDTLSKALEARKYQFDRMEEDFVIRKTSLEEELASLRAKSVSSQRTWDLEKSELLSEIRRLKDNFLQDSDAVLMQKEQYISQLQETIEDLKAKKDDELKEINLCHEKEILSFRSKINECEESISQNKKEIENLQSLNLALQEADKTVGLLLTDEQMIVEKADYGALSIKIDHLTNSCAQKDQLYATLQKKTESYQQMTQNISSQFKKKTEECGVLMEKIRYLESKIAHHEKEKNTLKLYEAELASCRSGLSSERTENVKLLNELNAEKIALQKANEQLKVKTIQFGKIESDYKFLHEEYTKLQSQNKTIREEVQSMYSSEVETLKAAYDCAQVERTDLTTKYDNLKKDLEAKENMLARSLRRINQLGGEIGERNDVESNMNKDLKREISHLRDSLELLQGEKTELINATNETKKQLQAKQMENSVLETEVQKLNREKARGLEILKELNDKVKFCAKNHSREPLTTINQ